MTKILLKKMWFPLATWLKAYLENYSVKLPVYVKLETAWQWHANKNCKPCVNHKVYMFYYVFKQYLIQIFKGIVATLKLINFQPKS